MQTGKSEEIISKLPKVRKVREFEKNDVHGQGKSVLTFSGQVSNNKMHCFIDCIGLLFYKLYHDILGRYQRMKCIDLYYRYF